MGWFKTKVSPWFESKEQRKEREERDYETEMRRQGRVPITVDTGQFTQGVRWVTPEEREEHLQYKERTRQKLQEGYSEQAAAKNAAKKKNMDNRLAACRALIAEADAAEADITGGYRRRRMTKRKRQNKTKRSRK